MFHKNNKAPLKRWGPFLLNISGLFSYGLRFVAIDLDFMRSRLRLSDVAGRLQTYPGLRCGAEGPGQPNRHVAGNPRTAVDQVRESSRKLTVCVTVRIRNSRSSRCCVSDRDVPFVTGSDVAAR